MAASRTRACFWIQDLLLDLLSMECCRLDIALGASGGRVNIRKMKSGHLTLVGECSVHRLMVGKALDMVSDFDWIVERDITPGWNAFTKGIDHYDKSMSWPQR